MFLTYFNRKKKIKAQRTSNRELLGNRCVDFVALSLVDSGDVHLELTHDREGANAIHDESIVWCEELEKRDSSIKSRRANEICISISNLFNFECL